MGGRIDEKWWPPPPMIGIQQYCNPPLHLQRQADVIGDGDRTEMEFLLGSKTSERLQAFEEGDQLHYKDVMEGNMVIFDFGDQPDDHMSMASSLDSTGSTGKKVIQSIVTLI